MTWTPAGSATTILRPIVPANHRRNCQQFGQMFWLTAKGPPHWTTIFFSAWYGSVPSRGLRSPAWLISSRIDWIIGELMRSRRLCVRGPPRETAVTMVPSGTAPTSSCNVMAMSMSLSSSGSARRAASSGVVSVAGSVTGAPPAVPGACAGEDGPDCGATAGRTGTGSTIRTPDVAPGAWAGAGDWAGRVRADVRIVW